MFFLLTTFQDHIFNLPLKKHFTPTLTKIPIIRNMIHKAISAPISFIIFLSLSMEIPMQTTTKLKPSWICKLIPYPKSNTIWGSHDMEDTNYILRHRSYSSPNLLSVFHLIFLPVFSLHKTYNFGWGKMEAYIIDIVSFILPWNIGLYSTSS